jgi:uncharacterized protein YycO
MNFTPRIALHRGTGFVGWAIQKQTRSVYSHASMLIPGTRDRIIEAREFQGVRLHTLTEDEMRHIDWFAVPEMTVDQYERSIQFALQQLGMPYDYWSVARFLSKRPARENGKWFCSELVHKALSESGVRLLARIPSAEISPGMLSYSPLIAQVSPP